MYAIKRRAKKRRNCVNKMEVEQPGAPVALLPHCLWRLVFLRHTHSSGRFVVVAMAIAYAAVAGIHQWRHGAISCATTAKTSVA